MMMTNPSESAIITFGNQTVFVGFLNYKQCIGIQNNNWVFHLSYGNVEFHSNDMYSIPDIADLVIDPAVSSVLELRAPSSAVKFNNYFGDV